MEKTERLKTVGEKKEKGVFAILFDLFRSLKLTITLLILLAFLSIIGTLITQNATAEDYVRRYGVGLYEVLHFFNLFDMYHSLWFSAILLLLVVNLVACSAHRLPGIWGQIFRGAGPKGLEDSMLKPLPYVEKIKVSGEAKTKIAEAIRPYLQKRFGGLKSIETESAVTLFGEKGRFSRLGVPLAHLSILVILVGGLLGSLYGFKGHVEILEGETVDQIHVRGKNGDIPRPLGFSVRCDDFSVAFYETGGQQRHVKAYTSLLSILEGRKEVLKKKVEVNHPLHYKGLAFYQSTYGALRDITLGVQERGKKEKTLLKVAEGETVPVPGSNAFVRLIEYAPQIHNFGEGVQIVVFRPNREPKPLVILKNYPSLSQKGDGDLAFSLEEVSTREYTGLQVTKDPGVWVVWIGCSLMVLGLVVSFFFSHRKIWLRLPKGPTPAAGEIVLAGTASKNRIAFEKTFHELAEQIRSLGKG